MGESRKKTALKIKYDGQIAVATGKSRWEKSWKNKSILWSQMVEKLSNTTRTPETVTEYKKMAKADKDNIKDVGGFVGGSLKGGRRKAENVANRSIITLDMDNAAASAHDIWDTLVMVDDYAIVMYSTHSHTPDNPRLRLVIPLSRPVLGDEYQAVARMIANDMGIDQFDDTTYEPHRLMYWPSTPADGEYIFKFQDGKFLDPDTILNKYLDWRDVTYWPESSRQAVRINSLIKKQEDPLDKKGIIGAFCRTFTVQEAIAEFIPETYTATSKDDRYTYAEGSTVGGVVIYEDKFSYSHHGTDPASGILCNTFDLIRIHKFGIKDEDAKPDTPANRLPSFTAMSQFAGDNDRVKLTLGTERYKEALDEFDIDGTAEEADQEWLKEVDYDSKGNVLNTIKNVITILNNDPLLKDKIGFNEFANRALILDDLPWNKNIGSDWKDSDDAGVRFYLESIYGITNVKKIDDALKIVFEENTFHPVRDYLNALTWDGINRIDTLLIEYLGAEYSEYTQMVTRKWMCGAVARIFKPGIKFDYMLVLSGPQGLQKSSFLRILAKDWFTDSLQDVEGNQAIEKLMNSWIIEFGELQAFSRAESNAIKRFITSQEDRTRLAYDRRSSYLKRQCVFAGTTNKSEFLKDTTGNRRYWPVEINREGRTKDVFVDLPKELDQIWAEAVVLWRDRKESIYLSVEEEKLAMLQQEEHREVNEKEGLIISYLDTPLPENWERMDLYQRREFLKGEFELEGKTQRDKVCVLEIWCECLEKNRADIKKADSLEINAILSRLDGWTGRNKNREYFNIYGRQRVFERILAWDKRDKVGQTF